VPLLEKLLEGKEQYYAKHTNCPVCGSGGDNIKKSDLPVTQKDDKGFFDTINTACCAVCKWIGKIDELISQPGGKQNE